MSGGGVTKAVVRINLIFCFQFMLQFMFTMLALVVLPQSFLHCAHISSRSLWLILWSMPRHMANLRQVSRSCPFTMDPKACMVATLYSKVSSSSHLSVSKPVHGPREARILTVSAIPPPHRAAASVAQQAVLTLGAPLRNGGTRCGAHRA